MKPENAIVPKTSIDLSVCAVEDALFQLRAPTQYILRVHPAEVERAQRVTKSGACIEETELTHAEAQVVGDETYVPGEWSVECNGKILWNEAF